MNTPDPISSLSASVMVCDAGGMITYMNSAAEEVFAKRGGRALLGTNLLDCHNPESREKIKSLMRDGRSNIYTIEKNGIRRLIYQSPWYRDGRCAGLVEISFEVPFEIPHIIRK